MSTTTTEPARTAGGALRRLAALAAAAATLLAGGLVAAAPMTAHAADEANVALNNESNDNIPETDVSYVTGWNSTAALNDGSLDPNASYGGWGTWGNTSASESATYTWERDVTTSRSAAYYWTNVKTGDAGVPLPKDVSIEYLDAATGDYEAVPNLKVDKAFPADADLDASNPLYGPYTYTFDKVTTKSLKLVVNKQANDNKGITVTEWQVFGTSAEPAPDPSLTGPFMYTQEVAVRTTPGADPTSKLPAEVWGTPENGPSVKVPVKWAAIPASAYATAGKTAEVKGTTTAGTYDGVEVGSAEVTATITVADQLDTEVTDAEYVSTITTPGKAPVFQDTVALTYADGSVESGHKVTWGDIDPADYAEAEQMGEVEGTVEGTDAKALGTFFVVDPSAVTAKPIVSLDFAAAPAGSGWYVDTPQFSITAEAGSSDTTVKSVEYKIGDGAWTAYTAPVAVDAEGEVTVSARATDSAGTVKEVSKTIKVDTKAPVTTAKEVSREGNDVVVELTTGDGDNGSGINRLVYSTGPSEDPNSTENTMYGDYTDADKIKVQLVADHDTYVHWYAQDNAGNAEAKGTLNLGKATEEPTPTPDTVAPVFAGVADATVEFGAAFDPMAGVSASDDVDGDVTSSIKVSGTVDTKKAGDYTLTYTVADAAGNEASATRKVTVKPQSVEPEPEPSKPLKFTDVVSATPHASDIQWLGESGISTGWKTGETDSEVTAVFSPMGPVVRQDMAAFLYRLAGSPAFDESKVVNPFVDVKKSTPHYKEIMWLYSTGISTGFTDEDGVKTFKPMGDVVRQDMAAFLRRLADVKDAKPELGQGVTFTDVSDKTPHADDIQWLAQAGVTTGWKNPDGKTAEFRGMNVVVRQDMAAFLHRMSSNVLAK